MVQAQQKASETTAVQGQPATRSILLWLGRWALFGFLMAAFATTAFLLQRDRLNQIQLNPPYIDDMLLPRKEHAKALAIGYDMFAADFLFVRAVQAFGARNNIAAEQPDAVFHFFDVLTHLDPHFIEAYEFGNLVLGEGGGRFDLAAKLCTKGWVKNPNHYRIPFLAAYDANWNENDPARAKLWAERARQADNAPEWLTRWVSYFDLKSGRFEAAFEPALRQYLAIFDDPNRSYEAEINLSHLKNATHEWNMQILNSALKKYWEDHEQIPENIQDLAEAGYLDNYRGVRWAKVEEWLEPQRLAGLLAGMRARGEAEEPTDLLKTLISMFIGEKSGVPASPFEISDGSKDKYMLRKGISEDVVEEGVQEGHVIGNLKRFEEIVGRQWLPFLRNTLAKFQEENGRWPESLEEAFPEGLNIYDPVTGYWDYDPTTGVVKSPGFPEL